jgi:hypothetical protein
MAKTDWRSPVHAWCLAIALLSSPLLVAAAATPAEAVVSESLALNGVYCTSQASCWAVGNQVSGGGTRDQVLRLKAGKWRQVTVPEPGGTAAGDNNNLNAVRCASAMDCWAVGDYQPLGSARLDQVLHWNGTKWSVVSAPAPGGTAAGDFNELNDVACTSAASCWAVGYYGIEMSGSTGDSVVQLTQALHWNGTKWSLVPSPNPGGHSKNHVNSLNAIRCGSARDCWAAGSDGLGSNADHRNLMLHWNGASWTTVTVPSPGGTTKSGLSQIRSLSCTSPTSCWAAGSYGKELSAGHQKLLNQILRWTGRRWVKVTAPNPDGTGPKARNDILAISCITAGSCWAAGGTGAESGRPGLNQALHWNGAKWSVIRTPEPGGTGGDVANILTSVRCATPGNCQAVGVVETSTGAEDQILHWNGTRWTTTLGPS